MPKEPIEEQASGTVQVRQLNICIQYFQMLQDLVWILQSKQLCFVSIWFVRWNCISKVTEISVLLLLTTNTRPLELLMYPPHDAGSVTVPIIPKIVGEVNVEVMAIGTIRGATVGVDAVRKPLFVVVSLLVCSFLGF